MDRATLDARGIGVGAFARELRNGGARLVQYRDKQGSPQEVLAAATEISAVFAGTDAMLVMNDRADLAVLAGWSGVHVGHLDMPVEAVRRALAFPQRVKPHERGASYGPAAAGLFRNHLVGVSTHNDEQVRAAEAWGKPRSEGSDPRHPLAQGPEYIAIGPVFATASKADAEAVVGLEGVRRARALTRKPLVAIGGITRANARAVIEAGADSVAVIGGLFASKDKARASVADVVRDFLRILG